MPTFKIPVIWESCGTLFVDAETLEEAEALVYGDEPLPHHSEYIEGSIQLDKENLNYGKK